MLYHVVKEHRRQWHKFVPHKYLEFCGTYEQISTAIPGMLRPRGLCGLEAKLFGLGLVVSGLGLGFGLVASGLVLTSVGLVATKICRLRGLLDIPGVYWLLT